MTTAFAITVNDIAYKYNNRAEYDNDMADGILDGVAEGKKLEGFETFSTDSKIGAFFIELFTDKIDEKDVTGINLTEADLININSLDANRMEALMLHGQMSTRESKMNNYNTISSTAESGVENREMKIEEYKTEYIKLEEDLEKVNKEIEKYRKEEQERQEKELFKATSNAEKLYDPKKDGEDKDAYIAKQTGKYMNTKVDIPPEFAAKLRLIESQMASVKEKIKAENDILSAQKTVADKFNEDAAKAGIEKTIIQTDVLGTEEKVQIGENAMATIDEVTKEPEDDGDKDKKKK